MQETENKNYVAIAQTYIRDVIQGGIPACHYVKQACLRHLKDIKKSEEDTGWAFVFDKGRANDVCDFAEKLPYIEGRWDQPTLKLEPWQIFILCMVFGWRKKNGGGRRFSKVYTEVARKNGKSTLAAIIVLYCFTCEDEPAPYIFIGATTGSQAQKVFHPAKMMALRTPALCEHFGIKVMAKSLLKYDGGYVQTINSRGNTNDGHNPHLAVLDELHAHQDRGLYDVIDSALGARANPLLWIITTAGFNMEGVCYEQRSYAAKVLEGMFEADHLFTIIYTLDKEEIELATSGIIKPEWFIKANPNLGVSVRIDNMETAAKEAMGQAGKLADFLTKRLNIWTTAGTGHINISMWNACNGEVNLEELRRHPCWMGVDLAATSDLTSIRLVWRVNEELFTWGLRYIPEDTVDIRSRRNGVPYARWVCQPPACTWHDGSELGEWLSKRRLLQTTSGNVTDYAVVEEDIKACLDIFQVRMIGYDPWNATDLVNRLMEHGAPLLGMRQGPKSLSGPIKYLDRMYMSKMLCHGGDEVLAWCASNVVMKTDDNDNKSPTKRRSVEKIDDYVALLNALGVMLAEETEQASVYEERGLWVI